MPLQTIEPRRLYRQIADQLRLLIEHGEYAVGARLPPERDLAQQLSVSRPSVREALIALEVEGLVEVRMGSGVYVRSASAAVNGRRVVAEAPLETIRARELIEAELAAQAARRVKPALVRGLREALAIMEQDAAAGQVPLRGDRLFHLRIAEAADNSVLLRVVTDLFDERHSNPLYEQLGSHFETAQSWAAALAEHRAVLDAIVKRSAGAAREAMRRHLANSHDRFTASWPARAGSRERAPARAVARARRASP
jgi:GntR family transcriptional repressor for pyruvate dehydrogenase complex